MRGEDIINEFKKVNGRQMFVTKRQIADALGVKQTRSVNWVTDGLPVINGKYYFLTDVKNAILRRTE